MSLSFSSVHGFT